MTTKHMTVMAICLFSVLCFGQANAEGKSSAKKVNKGDCELAGGTYSEGKNYTRCGYSNGDSYTCNSDVNKCESCTNGNCTVERNSGAKPNLPAKPMNMAPAVKLPGNKSPVKPSSMKKMDSKGTAIKLK